MYNIFYTTPCVLPDLKAFFLTTTYTKISRYHKTENVMIYVQCATVICMKCSAFVYKAENSLLSVI